MWEWSGANVRLAPLVPFSGQPSPAHSRDTHPPAPGRLGAGAQSVLSGAVGICSVSCADRLHSTPQDSRTLDMTLRPIWLPQPLVQVRADPRLRGTGLWDTEPGLVTLTSVLYPPIGPPFFSFFSPKPSLLPKQPLTPLFPPAQGSTPAHLRPGPSYQLSILSSPVLGVSSESLGPRPRSNGTWGSSGPHRRPGPSGLVRLCPVGWGTLLELGLFPMPLSLVRPAPLPSCPLTAPAGGGQGKEKEGQVELDPFGIQEQLGKGPGPEEGWVSGGLPASGQSSLGLSLCGREGLEVCQTPPPLPVVCGAGWVGVGWA